MKVFKGIVAFIIIIALIADIVLSFHVYNLVINRTENTQKQSVQANAELFESYFPQNESDFFDKRIYEEVTITSYDGLKLKGYYLRARIPTSKTVILAHGYSSQGTFMGSYAKLYYEQFGYNVLMPDGRGHGNSEGAYTGFGWIDRLDYLKWIDFVISMHGQDSQLVLHGVSMGGATVLMTSGENIPKNVKAIVSDCAYTSVKEELQYQFQQMYRIPGYAILNTTSIITKLKAGYFFGEASALNQVKKSKTPILFIHGSADDFVPSYMVNILYKACNSEKDLLMIANAGHGAAYSTDPDRYTNEVNKFIEEYVK